MEISLQFVHFLSIMMVNDWLGPLIQLYNIQLDVNFNRISSHFSNILINIQIEPFLMETSY